MIWVLGIYGYITTIYGKDAQKMALQAHEAPETRMPSW